MKKLIASVISVALLVASLSGFTKMDSSSTNAETHLLELYCQEGVSLQDAAEYLDGTVVSNLVGLFDYEGQVITFSRYNWDNLAYDEYLEYIQDEIREIKQNIQENLNNIDLDNVDNSEDIVYYEKNETTESALPPESDDSASNEISTQTDGEESKEPTAASSDASVPEYSEPSPEVQQADVADQSLDASSQPGEEPDVDAAQTSPSDEDEEYTEFKIQKVEYYGTPSNTSNLQQSIEQVPQRQASRLAASSESAAAAESPWTIKQIDLEARAEYLANTTTSQTEDQEETDSDDSDIGLAEISNMLDEKAETPSDQSHSGEADVDATASLLSSQYCPGAGGPQYPDTVGNPGLGEAAPQKGDRQDRLRQQQRFVLWDSYDDGAVYDWLPSHVKGVTSKTNNISKSIWLEFEWNQNGLDNLVIDDNEALEVEVLLYNEGKGVGIPGDGTAWYNPSCSIGTHKIIVDFDTNLPSGYLDTRYGDSDKHLSFSAGTPNAENLVANTVYYVQFKDGVDNSSSNNSRLWRINFQRSYYYDHPSFLYQAIRGSGPEWFVWAEEYETQAVIKPYSKYNEAGYAPISNNSSNVFDEQTVRGAFWDQFRYKADLSTSNAHEFTSEDIQQKAWHKVINIYYRNYSVSRFQVNEAGYYSIYTSKSTLTNYDTTLTIYDHHFDQIAYNDNADGSIFSKIYQYFPKGEYYIIVRSNPTSPQSFCNINATKGYVNICP